MVDTAADWIEKYTQVLLKQQYLVSFGKGGQPVLGSRYCCSEDPSAASATKDFKLLLYDVRYGLSQKLLFCAMRYS